MLGNKTLKSTLIGGLLTIAGMAFSFQANAACELVSTVDGTPLNIKATAEDSEHAKTFLETCKNPYTKITVDAHDKWAALKDKADRTPEENKAYITAKKVYYKARREYNYNNCTGCHGGKLEGVMAPGLKKQPSGGQSQWDNMWVYPKNATDKGMFETIAGGTPGKSAKGTMFKWHKQIEGHTGDGLSTDAILKAIAYIRAHYEGKDEKVWLK